MMYVLFTLLGFASSLISSVFGFGSAMVVLAVGPYLLPAHQVIALSAILFAASTVAKTFAFRSHIHWRLVGYITAGSLPFAYLGGLLLPHLSQSVLQRSLGMFVLVYVGLKIPAVNTAFGHVSRGLSQLRTTASVKRAELAEVSAQKPPGKIFLIAVAASYGFASGLIGSGSIIKAIFFRQLEMRKEAFVGTMAATSVVATIGKIVAYVQTGLLHGGLATPIVTLIVVAVCAVVIGKRFLQKIDSELFNHGITLLVALAGLGLLL